MSYDAMAGFVFVLPAETIQKHAPQEYDAFKAYAARFDVALNNFANGIEQGDGDQMHDAFTFEYEEDDDGIILEFVEMSQEEYEDACVDRLEELLKELKDAFHERTGVKIDLWCNMCGSEGSQYNDLDLDEAHWIMRNCVTVTPEAAAIGVTDFRSNLNLYTIFG